MRKIQAVLLDLGNVVLDLDWARVALTQDFKNEKLQNFKNSPEELASFQNFGQFVNSWQTYDQYERGLLSTPEFFKLLKEKITYPRSLSDLQTQWDRLIYQPVNGIEEVLQNLPGSIGLYGLSNTNESHFRAITEHFPILRRFQKIFTSFHLGFRKPEMEIFAAVCEKLNLGPQEVLFLDDSGANVQGAADFGFCSEHCLSSASRMEEIFLKYKLTTQ